MKITRKFTGESWRASLVMHIKDRVWVEVKHKKCEGKYMHAKDDHFLYKTVCREEFCGAN